MSANTLALLVCGDGEGVGRVALGWAGGAADGVTAPRGTALKAGGEQRDSLNSPEGL